jgi:pyruvate/2-oxoglutarate dehydrogenase complex dihydrolipoamide acyltransferase (E2) component
MKSIEEVQIPLLVMPPPETCRLIKWHVRDGSHVTVGEPIFDLEVDDAIWEVESFYTGHIKINAPVDSVHKVGDCIASMFCEKERKGHVTIGIELPLSQVARLDSLRGKTPRREFLCALLGDALSEENQISEQFVDDNPS